MTDSSLFDAAAPIDRFRACLLADPALQQRLSVLSEPEAFVGAMIDAAAGLGIAIAENEGYAALRADPLGLWRFSGAPVTSRTPPEGDWLPVAVVPSVGELAVDWAHFAGQPLAEPFYEDSLRNARHLPFNRLLQQRTPLVTLAESLGDELPVPDGFVFHLSRCGSTLVSQMFAADPRNIVISEAPPIDSVVQLGTARTDVPIELRIMLLRAMVGALGRDRAGASGHFIVKLDSWHTLALPLFRLAFPDTPWIFLYREPVEILVSHARMSGSQTVFGALPFDPYGIENGADMAPDHYAGRALGRTASAVIEHFGLGGGLLVNYTELPGAMESRIVPHFGIVPDAAESAAMAGATRRDAKAPTESFGADSATKQQEASAELRSIAAAYMDEPYRCLEALRLAGDT
ncbi:MAG: hypothetical protein JWN66_3453 [Sphingomonas bacterium]|uniref:hypothetical protein n=1 Tax=Sphingomonas bacterium TaxID=1895847 RepID=UPI002628F684|nr:hypothetical protein [Sphingomonas bacterium]MDB5706337.1 hypothetical protein [Sphingomonas bacterium]